MSPNPDDLNGGEVYLSRELLRLLTTEEIRYLFGLPISGEDTRS